MMGTSLLSMPWAVEKAGFALGMSLLLLMAMLCLYTSYRVMTSVDTIGKSRVTVSAGNATVDNIHVFVVVYGSTVGSLG